MVGYPTGSKINEPEMLSSIPASHERAEVRLYRQEIDHNYKLLASPDGGRENISLKTSYRYYVKSGDGEMRELTFLRSDPGVGPHPDEYFKNVHPLSTGDGWIAYGLCSGESDYDSSGWYPETPEKSVAAEKETSRYFIIVFSPTQLKARVEVIATQRKPGIEYREAINALRYRGPAGWMLYRVAENLSVKDPNAPEPTPGSALPPSYKRINGEYWSDASHVYWIKYEIPGADPHTFSLLAIEPWSRDAKQCYWTDHPVPLSDPKTFVAINTTWARDANHYYAFNESERCVLVVPCDYRTMKILSASFAKDKERVFCGGKEVAGADLATFKPSGEQDARDKFGTYGGSGIFTPKAEK